VGESDVFHGHLSQRVASPDELSDERSHRDNAAIRQVVVVAAHTTLRKQRGQRHAPCAAVREEKGASSAPCGASPIHDRRPSPIAGCARFTSDSSGILAGELL